MIEPFNHIKTRPAPHIKNGPARNQFPDILPPAALHVAAGGCFAPGQPAGLSSSSSLAEISWRPGSLPVAARAFLFPWLG